MAGEDINDPPRHQASPSELKARIEAERRGRPFLLFTDGEGRQRIVVLDAERQGPVVVGRGPEADVSLDWDSDVSRLHAELAHLGGCWTVADDGLSRNGTFLNGVRLRGRCRLAEFDRLRFGATTVVCRMMATTPSRGTTTQRASSDDAPVAEISAAQRRVLIALARPYFAGGSFATPATNREIADELFLSIDTVKTHLRALTLKFGIQDLPQQRKRSRLVELAMHTGEISERDAV